MKFKGKTVKDTSYKELVCDTERDYFRIDERAISVIVWVNDDYLISLKEDFEVVVLDSENRINHIPDILKKYIQKSGEKNYQLYKEAVDIIRMLKDDELDSFIEFAMDSGLKISDIDEFKQVLITIRKTTQS